jgi:hypothetical protein
MTCRHTLTPTSTMGAITHMWSTACGANANPDEFSVNSGVVVYRIYVDGETNASIELTPRMAAGIGFPPSPGGGVPNGGGGGGGGGGGAGTQRDEYVMGGHGETCTAACAEVRLQCDPNITGGLSAAYLVSPRTVVTS